MQDTWESVACEIHEESGYLGGAIDAFVLAECCGLSIRPWPFPTACIDLTSGTIRISMARSPRSKQRLVAHEIGHWALRRAGVEDSEEAADYVALALLLPGCTVARDLAEVSSLDALLERHPNVSRRSLARRLVHLRAGSRLYFAASAPTDLTTSDHYLI